MASLKVACVVLMCMAVVGAPMVQATITCAQVTASLAPCLGYLRTGGAVPPPCCNGVKSLLSAAKTTVDRQAACNCLKTAASTVGGLNPQNTEALPGKCGVSLPYKFSTSTNCATVKF